MRYKIHYEEDGENSFYIILAKNEEKAKEKFWQFMDSTGGRGTTKITHIEELT